jgi:hypothetical protein
MRLARLAVAGVLAAVCTVVALPARAAASAESVERLMQAMQVQAQLDAMYAQTLPAMQGAMKQAIARQGGGEEAMRVFDEMMPRVSAVIRDELSWTKLKPEFAAVYAETFSQEEVDGLIAFYSSPLGKALLQKTPMLAQRSMQMMQRRIGPMMERVMRIVREESAKSRPASAPRR